MHVSFQRGKSLVRLSCWSAHPKINPADYKAPALAIQMYAHLDVMTIARRLR
jgi:hypothetical protein